jgi:hypothetical protein
MSEKWSRRIGGTLGAGFGWYVEHWNEAVNEKSDPNNPDTIWDKRLGNIGLAQSILRDISPLKTDLVVHEQLGSPREGGTEAIWNTLGFVPAQQKIQGLLIFGEEGPQTNRFYLTYGVETPTAEYLANDDRVGGITGFSLGFLERGLGLGYRIGVGDSGRAYVGGGLIYERIFRHGHSFSFPFSVAADLQKGLQSRGFFDKLALQVRPSIGVRYQFSP